MALHPISSTRAGLSTACRELDLSTLMAGQDYYLRVDSFNENGITEGSLLYCPAENHK